MIHLLSRQGCHILPFPHIHANIHMHLPHVYVWGCFFFFKFLGHIVGLAGCNVPATPYILIYTTSRIEDSSFGKLQPVHQVVVYIVYNEAIHLKSSKHGILSVCRSWWMHAITRIHMYIQSLGGFLHVA